MITKRNSTNLVRPLAIVALAKPQMQDWQSSLSAPAAGGGSSRFDGSYSNQIKSLPFLNNLTAGAAVVSHPLMLRHNTAVSSMSKIFSGQPDASFALAKGRTRRG